MHEGPAVAPDSSRSCWDCCSTKRRCNPLLNIVLGGDCSWLSWMRLTRLCCCVICAENNQGQSAVFKCQPVCKRTSHWSRNQGVMGFGEFFYSGVVMHGNLTVMVDFAQGWEGHTATGDTDAADARFRPVYPIVELVLKLVIQFPVAHAKMFIRWRHGKACEKYLDFRGHCECQVDTPILPCPA